jgi:hypothetical protein
MVGVAYKMWYHNIVLVEDGVEMDESGGERINVYCGKEAMLQVQTAIETVEACLFLLFLHICGIAVSDGYLNSILSFLF